MYGEKGTGDLLIFSQVVLSLQLGFAVVPLVDVHIGQEENGKLCEFRMASSARMDSDGRDYCIKCVFIMADRRRLDQISSRRLFGFN